MTVAEKREHLARLAFELDDFLKDSREGKAKFIELLKHVDENCVWKED